ncbi:MAG: phosphatase PAP2 family protein [Planctomycetes bacterium]|nr:phosphatase PAP2 family protein [Planctomycetota bacterium]
MAAEQSTLRYATTMLHHPIVGRHLAVAAAALVCAGAFVALATSEALVAGGTLAFDQVVGAWIPDLSPNGFEVVRDLTALGGPGALVLAVLLVVSYLSISGRWRSALLVALATGSGLGACALLKDLYERPRPELAIAPYAGGSDSFPSGHALMAAVVYLTLASLVTRLLSYRRDRVFVAAAALLLVGVVGASRVLLRVHYPSDVVAGWCLGTVWAVACWMVARLLQRRGQVEAV